MRAWNQTAGTVMCLNTDSWGKKKKKTDPSKLTSVYYNLLKTQICPTKRQKLSK